MSILPSPTHKYLILGRVIASFGLCLLLLPKASSQGNNLRVRTDNGVIQGLLEGQTVKFLGIPYATAKRFQFPNTNLPPSDNVFNATTPAPSCVQVCPETQNGHFCPNKMQEDCLTLNIYRPAINIRKGKKTLPVIVYLHGGDFSSGSSDAPIYDGNYFSTRGRVIVVVINYRLGALGFLSIFDKYGGASGNFGLRDQQAALYWINRNIAAFSGDSDQVTLMGDGSGCLSAVTHLASLNSQPLFQGAILQSCPFTVPFRNRQQAQGQSEAFAKFLDCNVNDVTCYRSKTTNDILHAQMTVGADAYTANQLVTFYPWGPSVDYSEVFYNPLDVFADVSRFSNKPIVIGIVADEGVTFVYDKYQLPLPLKEFNSFVASGVPNYKAVSAVPPSGDMRGTLVQVINNYMFACPARYVARQINRKQRLENPRDTVENKVWMYEFYRPTSLPPSPNLQQRERQQQQQQQQLTSINALLGSQVLSEKICKSKSCHGVDTQVLFNSDSLSFLERLMNEPISRRMVQYWANFAGRRNVNGAITSRDHLRTLQIRSALYAGPTDFIAPRPRPRSQRFSFRSFVPFRDTAPFRPATTSSLHSALKAFSYWPNFSSEGPERENVMLLQSPPLISRSNHFTSRCKGIFELGQ